MSRNRFYAATLLVFALAVTLGAPVLPLAEAGPGPIVPIFGDEIVSFVIVNGSTYVALSAQIDDLDAEYGNASLAMLSTVIANCPAASGSNEFVMHGSEAAGGAVQELANRGYDTETVASSSFPGCTDDTVYTD